MLIVVYRRRRVALNKFTRSEAELLFSGKMKVSFLWIRTASVTSFSCRAFDVPVSSFGVRGYEY